DTKNTKIRIDRYGFTFLTHFSKINSTKIEQTFIHMSSVNRMFPERRLSAAERRAGRRFIAQLMDEFPRLARLAYPVRGEGGIVYVRMPIPPEKARAIDEFAAALTGII